MLIVGSGCAKYFARKGVIAPNFGKAVDTLVDFDCNTLAQAGVDRQLRFETASGASISAWVIDPKYVVGKVKYISPVPPHGDLHFMFNESERLDKPPHLSGTILLIHGLHDNKAKFQYLLVSHYIRLPKRISQRFHF